MVGGVKKGIRGKVLLCFFFGSRRFVIKKKKNNFIYFVLIEFVFDFILVYVLL